VNSEVINLKYVIILAVILTDVSPNQNIGGDVSPASTAGLTPPVANSAPEVKNSRYTGSYM